MGFFEPLEKRRTLARADGFLAVRGETLEVAADHGVLVNDRDDTLIEIAAVLTAQPRHGIVELRPDGSFRFQPDATFVGTDRFEYVVDDGATRSDPVQVTLQVLAHPVVINELLASNSAGLRTRTRRSVEQPFSGESEAFDWIELRNLAARPADIGGYYLTDDPADLTKWQLPPGTLLEPNGYLLLFASGQNIVDGALDEQGHLHTNFRLSSSGEFLAWVDRNGRAQQQFSPTFPRQKNDVSYGFSGVDMRYLVSPTPEAQNSASLMGYLADVSAGTPHGFFENSFALTLSTPEPAGEIRYTLDGSEPTSTNGVEYTGPVTIAQTTVLRAAAFKPGFLASPVTTHTYIFLDDVVRQSPQGEAPPGWPQKSARQFLDYGMDPEIVDSPEWSPQMHSALTQVPSISLVTDLGHLFDPETGIYVNAFQDGIDWERPASVELINPDGTSGFQVNAGVRIRGGFSRGGGSPKHSFRLFFRSQYGDSRLTFPLFGSEGADRFEQVDLRTAQNNAWSNGFNRNSFLRDIFSRDSQRDMGQPYKRGRYYHLYLNGQYWGLYQTDERSEADFAATYFGGNEADFDVVKTDEGRTFATDGSLDKWNQLWELSNHGFAELADYYAVQGRNADGTDNPQLERHVDVDNLIDYMLLIFYTGNTDAPVASFGVNNFYAIRNRQTREGWKYFAHDSEHSLSSPIVDNTRASETGKRVEHFNPRWLHQQLSINPEYRIRFADRVRKHFFDGGVFTPEKAAARLTARAAEIDQAMIAESARWGDVTRRVYTKLDWQADVDWLLEQFVPPRIERVLRQLRDRGWYPTIDAPVLDPQKGHVPRGAQVRLSATTGRIYYTLDGSDPRAIGGGVSPTAATLENGQTVVLNRDAVVRARVLDGETWSALAEGEFTVGDAAAPTSLRITEVHYHPAPPNADEVGAGVNDADEFEFIELVNTSDQAIHLAGARLVRGLRNGSLEGVDFDFGMGTVPRLGAGDRVVVVENLRAFRLRYGDGPLVAGQWTGKLGNGGETLTLEFNGQVLQTFTYEDAWYPATDGQGASLELVISPRADVARWNRGESWRPSLRPGGTPGRPALLPGDINGDFVFDSLDLVQLAQMNQYEDSTPGNSTFQSGDWDGDGDFTTSDLVVVFKYGLYESTIAAAHW